MLSKNEIKYIQSLYHKKQRDEEELFLAEGPKIAEELLKSAYIIKHIYAVSSWIKRNPGLKETVTEVSDVELSRLSNLQTPNEVIVLSQQPASGNEPVFKGNFTLMLDGIQDPGNMGTIIRIADWFAIKQIICSHDCVDVYNPKVVQSSMGSLIRTSCWYQHFETWNHRGEIVVYGAVLKGKNIYAERKVTEGILVIGNEAKGIREPVLSIITHPVTIPKKGGAESLNAAVATGIIVGSLLNAQG